MSPGITGNTLSCGTFRSCNEMHLVKIYFIPFNKGQHYMPR